MSILLSTNERTAWCQETSARFSSTTLKSFISIWEIEWIRFSQRLHPSQSRNPLLFTTVPDTASCAWSCVHVTLITHTFFKTMPEILTASRFSAYRFIASSRSKTFEMKEHGATCKNNNFQQLILFCALLRAIWTPFLDVHPTSSRIWFPPE